MRREGPNADWLEELAAQPDAEDWVIKAAYPDGVFDFDPQPWHALYWQAWDALRFDRPYGAFGGEGSIPYMVIRAYAQDHGITGDDFRLFRLFMAVIDGEWLRKQAEKTPDKRQS